MDHKIILTDGTVREIKNTGLNSQAMSKLVEEANQTGWLKIGTLWIQMINLVSIEEM